ncbi:MAG: flagellar basal body P-ring formation chaperone FlgA [Acetobacteraceae bacterium]
MRFAAIAVLALLARPAQAATLRDLTSLAGPDVRLSDLFDHVEHDRIIGPAPEPGGRIVVEAAQLAAIARQFNVDWTSTSTADRVIIERPGKMFPQDAAMSALHDALAVAGVPADSDVEMPGFTTPMVPTDGSAHAEVGQVEYDPISGRFTSMLSIIASGMAPTHMRLSGRVEAMVEVPVATRRMLPGEIVGPGDVKLSRIRANMVRTEIVRLPEQAIGQAVRHHQMAPGAPMPVIDLGSPMVVAKGTPVVMELTSPGLSLTAQGMAAEPGAMGDTIHVMNPISHALVEAVVVGPDRVRVAAGASLPVRIARQ